MTRLGWTILATILVAIAGFASLLSFGSGAPRADIATLSAPAPPPAPSPEGKGDRDSSNGAGLVVPVAGYPRSALADNWGDPRGGGLRTHQGLDIMAPARTPVVAAVAGRVEKLFESRLGGTTLYQRSDDGRWTFYYAHLAGYAPAIIEGRHVRAGETIAYVGDTGDAGPGNFHLHFGISRMRPGERWWQGEAVNPYPILARARSGR